MAASPAKLIVSLLSRHNGPRRRAVEALTPLFGPLERLSAAMPFGPSDYYASEMGLGLERRLAVFERLVAMDDLARIKKQCMSLEQDMARDGRREVNIDPGLLTAGALILATRKYQWHRLPLGHGLYCELTLFFRHGQYRAQDWTYQDYASQDMLRLLMLVRQRYLWRLKQQIARDDGEA